MVAIRRAEPADARGIARVHCQSHRETYLPIMGEAFSAPDPETREREWQQRLRESGIAFVAIADETIVGFAHAIETADGKAILTTLYLLADWQRRGIGRDLLAVTLSLLHERGHDSVRFDVLPGNAQAITFYELQGARQLGSVISDHGGDPHEDLLFEMATRPSRSGTTA